MPGGSPAGAAKGVSGCLSASARPEASQKPTASPRNLPPSVNPPPVRFSDRASQARQAPSSPARHAFTGLCSPSGSAKSPFTRCTTLPPCCFIYDTSFLADPLGSEVFRCSLKHRSLGACYQLLGPLVTERHRSKARFSVSPPQ